MVNVAGITRPTSFADGQRGGLARRCSSVHLDGYLNVLGAALPIMAAAGRGRILGVTSGSGWRPADAGAYGCAKRAVAALTWQLGRQAPPGVVVNAMSPIAVTRMVTAALGRRRAPSGRRSAGGSSATGGLSLGSMPEPDELGPFGAHLVGDDLGWCRGQVVFAGGSEVAVIDEPRLLEVVRTDDVASLAHVLEAVAAGALVPAEARAGERRREQPAVRLDLRRAGRRDAAAGRRAHVRRGRPTGPALAAAVTAALEARGVTCARRRRRSTSPPGSPAPPSALAAAADAVGPLDAVVVALARRRRRPRLATRLGAGARRARRHRRRRSTPTPAWARAVADHAAARRPAASGSSRSPTPSPPAAAAGPRPSAQLARAARAGHRRPRRRLRRQRRDGRRADGDRSASWRPTWCAAPRPPRCPAPSWWSAPAGSACAATRARAAASPSAVPTSPTGSTTRCGHRRRPAVEERPMTQRPDPRSSTPTCTCGTRPAPTGTRTSSGGMQLDMGDVTGMARRFDVPTYQAEAAGWNVEKLVNVAAATGGALDRRDARARPAGRRRRPPRRHRRRPPADRLGRRGRSRCIDRQMAASRFRGVRPMGLGRRAAPGRRRAPGRCRSAACSSS